MHSLEENHFLVWQMYLKRERVILGTEPFNGELHLKGVFSSLALRK